jgi:hypothetical protein
MKYIIAVTIFMVGCASTLPRPACNPGTANCERVDNRIMFKDTGRVR